MCKFFSLISDGKGKIYYFDSVVRAKILANELKYESADSHTSIADYNGFKGLAEDKMNKYEFNPLTKEFTVDQINTTNDSEKVKRKCLKLDFKKIVPQLIIKPIINPLTDIEAGKVTENDITDLKKWIKVRDSVRYSVRDSVRDSVRYSVRDSVRDSVWYSVWYSIRDSVSDSVWYSIRYSVRDSVWYSVRDSIYAYVSSFFDIEYEYDFSPAVRLWERGFVPSFDGITWRLLAGKNAKIVYEGLI